jgi:hypothetical protein
MGSHPTLDQQELAAEARALDPDHWRRGHAVAHLTVDHPQVRYWPDDNPYLAHETDHRDWIYDHPYPGLERDPVRQAEEAFDRLNPAFGVPADRSDPYGHRDVAQRERALSLGVRVAVHDSRQNDRNPVIWQPGQDYRIAEALQAARRDLVRVRWGPERLGPER